ARRRPHSLHDALPILMQATTLAPNQPVIWAELGFVQRFTGDTEAAVESFKRAAQHAMPDPYGVRVYYHLANAYQASGEVNLAVRSEETRLNSSHVKIS